MANRPVFLVDEKEKYIAQNYEFTFYPGFSYSQKEKNITSLHNAFLLKNPDLKILEVSTKSPEFLGRELSAFNLKYSIDGKAYPLECVFQSSKVFEKGGPFPGLLSLQPNEAKKSPLLQDNGKLIGFKLNDMLFPLTPTTFFYDWLYINSLKEKKELVDELIKYDAFTDIEFNPKKSINCQARSAAILVSLMRSNTLNTALESPEQFKSLVYRDSPSESNAFVQVSFEDLI